MRRSDFGGAENDQTVIDKQEREKRKNEKDRAIRGTTKMWSSIGVYEKSALGFHADFEVSASWKHQEIAPLKRFRIAAKIFPCIPI